MCAMAPPFSKLVLDGQNVNLVSVDPDLDSLDDCTHLFASPICCCRHSRPGLCVRCCEEC